MVNIKRVKLVARHAVWLLGFWVKVWIVDRFVDSREKRFAERGGYYHTLQKDRNLELSIRQLHFKSDWLLAKR